MKKKKQKMWKLINTILSDQSVKKETVRKYKMVLLLWKISWQFLKNIKLPYDTEIPLLGIYPREMKTYFHTILKHDW